MSLTTARSGGPDGHPDVDLGHQNGALGGVAVCRLVDLTPERGVAALVEGRQVALFRVEDAEGVHVFAIDHRDPCSGANVLARGIVGSTDGGWYVASPLHKHRFDLASGRCLDDDRVAVGTWAVVVTDGTVHVAAR